MKYFHKNLLLIFFLFSNIEGIYSQAGSWTWMGGDTIVPISDPGIYRTRGVADSLSYPGSLYSALCWTDKQGKFWLYGGTTVLTEMLSDMWMYDSGNGLWTWIAGDSGDYASRSNHALLGIASPLNKPGCRSYGAATWVDTSGNFWLFGGYSVDDNGTRMSMNDLWKYDVDSNLWTWVKGYGPPEYGTMGVPDIANNPPVNEEMGACWTDDNNNLWFYGGRYQSSLWRYNISTNEWTWMKGLNPIPIRGIKGIPDPANSPGQRLTFGHWKDDHGDLWLWGGTYTLANELCYNDLWRYSISTNQWTWMSGADSLQAFGLAGEFCDADSLNEPPGAFENRMCWKDRNGNFWMFSGGYGTSNSTYTLTTDDIWSYNPSTNQWMRVKAKRPYLIKPIYGLQGIPDTANTPYGRTGTTVWQDLNGDVWMYGGFIHSQSAYPTAQGDLWRFTPDSCFISVFADEIEVVKNRIKIIQVEGSSIFNIEFENNKESIKKIIIYDLRGRLIDVKHDLQEHYFRMESQSKGIYFCLLELKSGEKISKKFIFN